MFPRRNELISVGILRMTVRAVAPASRTGEFSSHVSLPAWARASCQNQSWSKNNLFVSWWWISLHCVWDKKLGCLCSRGKVRSRAWDLGAWGSGLGEGCKVFHCLVRKLSKASHRLAKWSFKRRGKAGPDLLLECVIFFPRCLLELFSPCHLGEHSSAVTEAHRSQPHPDQESKAIVWLFWAPPSHPAALRSGPQTTSHPLFPTGAERWWPKPVP